ncbi:hypothetical protein Cgig2_015396 [Carnegiea gigantea]|uniref:Reverse transcriptase domain-containing protein n=1 Tax=Carnegiea gigantea TaxID=171969 RepID=A0A9Q1JTW5_9CARY|nr:hypothetical protein Cgig2_015396 [Carnegiea gigantea]
MLTIDPFDGLINESITFIQLTMLFSTHLIESKRQKKAKIHLAKGIPCRGHKSTLKSAKFRNKNKYCAYYEDFGNPTSKCHELKKALHEPANQGQLNHFLKKGMRGDQNCCIPKWKKDNDVNYDMELITTIVGGIYDKELNLDTGKLKFKRTAKLGWCKS